MYGAGDVGGLVVVVGGMGLGVSEVVDGKVVGLGVGDVDEVPEEGGTSRMLEVGQCKPAMDASRLFSIKLKLLTGVITGNTNGCEEEHHENTTAYVQQCRVSRKSYGFMYVVVKLRLKNLKVIKSTS